MKYIMWLNLWLKYLKNIHTDFTWASIYNICNVIQNIVRVEYFAMGSSGLISTSSVFGILMDRCRAVLQPWVHSTKMQGKLL